MRVSIHEAVGGAWGAQVGLYDPMPLMLREGDQITTVLVGAGREHKVDMDEPFVVPRTGWYVVELSS